MEQCHFPVRDQQSQCRGLRLQLGVDPALGRRSENRLLYDQRPRLDGGHQAGISDRIPPESVPDPARWLLPMAEDRGLEAETALLHRPEGWQPFCVRRGFAFFRPSGHDSISVQAIPFQESIMVVS
jgi:hypothetical protein